MEYHVSINGDDQAEGTLENPFEQYQEQLFLH